MGSSSICSGSCPLTSEMFPSTCPCPYGVCCGRDLHAQTSLYSRRRPNHGKFLLNRKPEKIVIDPEVYLLAKITTTTEDRNRRVDHAKFINDKVAISSDPIKFSGLERHDPLR